VSDISVVHYCQSLLAFDLPRVTLARRFAKFFSVGKYESILTACLLTLCVYLVILHFFPPFHLVKLFKFVYV